MMFFGSFLNCSAHPTPINAGTTEYLEIQNAIYDELYMDSDINLPYDTVIPSWGYTTILNAKFHGNLLAGNVDFSLKSINAMILKKRKKDTYKWVTIHKIPIEKEEDFDFFYNDIVVASNTTYEYAAVPIVNGSEGTYQIISVDVWFEGAFIIDPTFGYQIYLDMKPEALTRPITSTILEPMNSPYPYVYYTSRQKYDRFGVSGFFMEKVGCNTWDADHGWLYRKRLRDFASNQLTKIVKFFDGRIYMACVIDGVTENTGSHTNYVTTTMNFIEVGDVENNSDLYYNGFSNYLEVKV